MSDCNEIEYFISKWQKEGSIDVFYCQDVDNITFEEVAIRCHNGSASANLMWDAMKNRKHITIGLKEETDDAQR